jgi:L-threonylcarbamoyladenylate synthase
MAIIGNSISEAKKILEKGELVAIPTETVYGLAANALDKEAVLKIFEVKERPFFDPLIVHIAGLDKLKDYVREIPDMAYKLVEHFWPGPLTIILPKKQIIPDITTSGLDQVAIRIPNHQLTLGLLKQLDFPLAAPSANPFKYISPTSAEHVAKQLGDKIPYILDGGLCSIGIESTIIGFEKGKPVLYRLGGLALEDIERIVGKTDVQLNSSANPKAPGQLTNHYAPRKPLFITNIREFLAERPSAKIGVISFQNLYPVRSANYSKVLSASGNMKEAAFKLFSALRELDESDVELIVSEIFPDNFLGRAINDRLKRASRSL